MAVETAVPTGRRTEVAPAVACILFGTAIITFSDALVKALTDTYPTGQILFIRGLFVWPWILVIAQRMGGFGALRIRSIKAHALRSIGVVASTYLFITGLRHLTFADCIAVAFTGPLFITAMAPLVLGEKVGWRRWLAVLIGFTGVLFMLRPGSSTLHWAIVFPLGAAVAGGVRDLFTRQMSNTETTVALLAATTTVMLLSGLVTAPFIAWAPLRTADVLTFATSGALVAIAHTLMIEAFRRGEAALVAPFKYSSLLWATLFGLVLFGELPDRWTIIGAIVIVLSGLYVLHRETKLKRLKLMNAKVPSARH